MSTLQPSGESLKKAVQWISDQRNQNPDVNLTQLVDDAGFRFDLSPKDCQFLLRMVKDDHRQNSA